MAAPARHVPDPLSPFEQLRLAREVVRTEGQTLLALADRLGEEFCHAVALLASTPGSVIVSGMGKAGLIGQKIAATFASTGTRSHFLHPSEAIHGDLGRVHEDDVALVLSFSGQTEEVVRILPALRELGVSIVALTGRPDSPLRPAWHPSRASTLSNCGCRGARRRWRGPYVPRTGRSRPQARQRHRRPAPGPSRRPERSPAARRT